MHLLAARARLFGERGVDHALGKVGFADHQRPIDLARAAAGESFGEARGAPRCPRDQQHARGVLVEPVDKARARRALVLDEGIEQSVDMLGRLAPALRGEAGRLVEHDRGGRLADHHVFRLGDLFGAERARARLGRLARGLLAARRHAQDLACGKAILGLGALAVDPDLAGARPARDRGEADLGQVALEPAVEPDAVVIRADGELADAFVGQGGGWGAHRGPPCTATRPMITAAIPATSEAAA